MKDRANILVLGTSGAGKSTLINTVIGEEVAEVRSGSHGTEKMHPYVSEDLNFQLIDSRGFEYNPWNTNKTVKDMKKWLKEGLKDNKPRIHMLWLCVDATSKRFSKQTIRTVEHVKKEWEDVPIIVALTKSFFVAEDEENIEMVKATFSKVAKRTGMPIAIIPVLSEAPKGENILPRGIEELIDVTEANLDSAVKSADEAVSKYKLKLKRMKAQALTIGAATSGGAIGAFPIDIPDSALLVPLESALVTGIAKIYKIDKKDELAKRIIERIIELGTVSMMAKAIINKLKLIPGVANIAADVLNAIVAGSIVFGIGEASTIIMEKVYKGDIDKDNLEWINEIVEGSMGVVIKKVSDFVSNHQEDINFKDILKELAPVKAN